MFMTQTTSLHAVLTPSGTAPAGSSLPLAPIVHLTGTNREPRVDSRDIARHLGIQHASAVRIITKYRDKFTRFGKLRFQIGKPTAVTGGRPERFAMLNEDQAYLLLVLSRSTPRTAELKALLIEAFRDSRHAAAVYRDATLPTTKELQDAIAAVPGGPGPWLFSNTAKLVNKAAGIPAGTRDSLTATQQAVMMLIQRVAAAAIRAATDAKDAYAKTTAALAPFMAVPLAPPDAGRYPEGAREGAKV